MTKASDFTHDERELLFILPFLVAGTSLAIVHVGVLKAMRTAISFYSIIRDTSQQFPDDECIQSIFALRGENEHSVDNELLKKHEAHTKEEALTLRNQVCEQALGILSEKAQPQEVENYKRWLLQVASECLDRAHSNGFLGLGRAKAEAEIRQALQDFRQVLHLEQDA
ncbi:MAG TPA: hypothetical protein VFU49_15865 [Ktedonobacteraceae bacterium]|nr:hypothetical protein [Ktedonobacteraceae bacterium]